MSTDLDILAVSPPGFPSASLAAAAHRAGIQGGVSLEHADSALAGRVLEELAAAGVPFTVFVPRLTSDIENLLKRAVGRGLTRLVLCEPDSACLGREIAFLRGLSLSVLVQAICLEDAKLAEKCGADAIVVKGSDGGGRIGEETTFILLQRIVPKVTLPVWARGGIGLHTAAACLTGGATGIVLDWQLALCEESQLPDDVKARIARMDGSETAVLGQELGRRYRAYARPGESAYAALKALEESLILDDAPSATRDQHWRDAVEAKIVTADAGDRLLLIGQDAVFAAPLAERFRSVKGIAQAMRRAAVSQCQSAARDQALRPGGPMAESHGTRYPIVQGPMTRVSDTADFALAVAEGGGLPFLALALLRGPQVADLLEETKRKLGKLPWGIGILGFVPKELREEQLAEVRKHPSPYAIIAGGRPDQAQALESQGIHTYLHIPSPALLKMFLEGGVRRVIFEGRECGGHVGPRTSFVLWDQMIRVILEHLDAAGSKGEDYHVLFAGGIHDAASASMVAAMAAPLSERGVRIGVLLGTSYLFTKEAVVSGAIVEGFQQEALACQQTILLESGVGHATRCADTPFGRLFAEEKRRLFREGRSKEEIREALEMLNLGRLRIASKGVTRSDPHAAQPQTRKFKQLDDQEQRGEGMYMIGQVAALRNSVCTIEELHDDVSRKGAERLQAYAAPKNDARVKDGSRPSDVAIIGMSCMFPKANDLRRFWENILAKVDAIQEIPADRWNWETYFDRDRTAKDKIYSKWGGFLDDVLFDPTSYGMPPNTLPSVEPLQLLVLEAVRQGLRDAGYENRPFPRERTSVVLGAGGGVADLGLGYGFRALLPYFMSNAGGDWSDAAELIERLEGALPEWTEDSFAGLLMNVAAGRVANRFDLGGSNYTVDAACASSLAAVRLAVNELESGSSDMVIVGGADTMQSPFAYLCFSKTQALSPTGQCRTFDESADGIVISEGIAVAILKRLDDAVRDGDRVYAVIKGVGSSSDGKDRGLTAPRPAGQIRALERAYAKAGYAPTTVGLVEAHGTGTVAGDQSEVESLTRAFTEAGADVQSCALGSVKSMIGHTKCTAGVAGLLKTALALYHRVLPATNGVKKPNPKANFEKSPFYLNSETRPWIARPDGQPRRASVSAFGFGGTNFHAALEEFIPPNGLDDAAPAVQTWPAELFVWRAESASTIVESLDAMTAALDQGAAPQLRDLAFAVWQSYGHRVGKCCLAVVAGTLAELQERMAAARAALHSGVSDVRDSKGVYYSSSPLTSNGKVAFLFPGQGSQSVNMLRDLAIAYPGVREVFEDADRSLGNELGRRLSSFVFPRPTFTPEEAEANDAALTQTNVAQPAMGAADMAMYTVLTDLGLRAECAGGHSYGEYAALCAAGAIHPADLMRISEARGRLVAQAGKESPGTMAAVDADEHTVAAVIGSLTDVWVANLNSPTQTVISGTQVGVEQALGKLSERGLHGRRIRVSCAFHSKLVAAAQTPFRAVLDEISFSSPRVPVFSNTTASPHTADPGAIKNQLVEHLARPVRFADELVAMYDAGSRVFVEVGPGRTLTGLVERTLAGRPFLAVNMDQPGRNGLLHLVHALAQLASAGVNMDLRRLFEGRIERTLDLGRLVEQTKPAPPSATTWKVNGARAVPLKEPTKRTGPLRKPVASPATPVTVTPVATAAPTASAASVLSTPPALRSAPTAIESSPSASVVQRDGIEGVMSAYQTLMAKFLDTQKSVMLSYLQGAPAPTMAQLSHVVAAPAQLQQSVLAPITPSVMTPIVQMETVIEPAAVAMEAVAVPDAPVPMAEQLVARLTKIVSDRTGYPPEMLNLDADLEADLGIDSIKRIEILGTLQNDAMLPAGSADGDMEVLAKLKTLRAIVDWIVAKSGEVKAPPTPSAPVAPQATPEPVSQKPPERIPRMLLQVQDCAVGGAGDAGPLAGVVLITDDEHGVANALAEALRGRGVSSVIVSDAGDGSGNGKHPRIDLADGRAVAEFAERIRKTHGRIGALVHLTPLEENAGARGDGPIQSRGSVHGQLQALFNLIQTLEPDLRKGGSGRILTATRMGGDFGSIGGSGAEPFRPGDGGICGMVKSLAREWTETACKAVDFDSAADNEQIVAALLSELDACDGISEVGHRRGNRIVLRPFDAPLSCASPTIVLDRDSVVLITGGARGITAEVAIELAERFHSRLILVGRSALPSEQESSQTAGVTDMRKLKEVLRQQIERAGEKANPAAIESAYTRLCRDRDIRQTLAAIRGAGAAVEHHALDVSDEKAFAELIDAVYARHGRLDGVIHGAGVTEDKFITDKTLESFGRVVRPKVDGGLTLASKLRFESLKFLFFFSSVSARYGNRGQCDYAAANEVLNKLACRLDGRTPARIASLNWGPWESSGGMVSAELAKQFAKAGIQLIARPAGRRAFMDELMYGRKGDVEVIFGGPLNVPTGRSPRPSAAAPSYPLVNGRTHITRGADGSIEAVRELDPAFDLYLLDHQLDGRPVMPMAMGLELLVEVASSGREGLQVARVRDLRVLRGVTLDNGPQPLRIWASPKLSTDGPMSLDLRAETLGDRPHLCYTAVVEFGSTPLAPPHLDPLVLTEAGPFRMSVEEAYEQWLFHGPLFAGITEIVRIGENGIIARLSPSSPRRCLSEAMDVGWLIDPVIIDSGLQLLILWARTYLDMTPLPSRFGCFHRYGDLSSGENRCEVRIRSASAGHPTIHADLMFRDSAGKLVGYLEDMEVTCSKALNRLSGTRTGSAGAKS